MKKIDFSKKKRASRQSNEWNRVFDKFGRAVNMDKPIEDKKGSKPGGV